MKFEEFNKLKDKIDKVNNVDDIEKFNSIVDSININDENFNKWVDAIFSDDIDTLDMQKIPYVLDCLYQSTDKYKVFLFCMLLEATCNKLPFITNLEKYPLFKEKYKLILRTLILTYESCNNGIGNCMALIILKNDPMLEFLDDETRNILVHATINKLKMIKDYLKSTKDINSSVYDDLEVIIDLACYLKNSEINNLVNAIDEFNLNDSCNIYIIKYKAINNLKIDLTKMNSVISGVELKALFSVLESINKINILPLDKINQEMIAKSAMIKWLMYPTELGKIPDDIKLIGQFEYNGLVCYAFKFKSNDFRIKDYMLGIAGGYDKSKLTSEDSGLTFSKFEKVEEDFLKQAKNIAEFIFEHWKKSVK